MEIIGLPLSVLLEAGGIDMTQFNLVRGNCELTREGRLPALDANLQNSKVCEAALKLTSGEEIEYCPFAKLNTNCLARAFVTGSGTVPSI